MDLNNNKSENTDSDTDIGYKSDVPSETFLPHSDGEGNEESGDSQEDEENVEIELPDKFFHDVEVELPKKHLIPGEVSSEQIVQDAEVDFPNEKLIQGEISNKESVILFDLDTLSVKRIRVDEGGKCDGSAKKSKVDSDCEIIEDSDSEWAPKLVNKVEDEGAVPGVKVLNKLAPSDNLFGDDGESELEVVEIKAAPLITKSKAEVEAKRKIIRKAVRDAKASSTRKSKGKPNCGGRVADDADRIDHIHVGSNSESAAEFHRIQGSSEREIMGLPGSLIDKLLKIVGKSGILTKASAKKVLQELEGLDVTDLRPDHGKPCKLGWLSFMELIFFLFLLYFFFYFVIFSYFCNTFV